MKEQRNIPKVCRDVTEIAKVLLELNLAKDIKKYKKRLLQMHWQADKRKCGSTATLGRFPGVEEKVELLNGFVVSVFTKRVESNTFQWCPVNRKVVKGTN